MAGNVEPSGWSPEKGDVIPVGDVSSALAEEPQWKRVCPMKGPAMAVQLKGTSAEGNPRPLHDWDAGVIPLGCCAGGNPPVSEVVVRSSVARSAASSSLVMALEAELLVEEQRLVEAEQRSRTVSLRAQLAKAQAEVNSSTRSRDSRPARDRRPAQSVSTRGGRVV